ncbi:MAG: glucosamine-6-phosphate deaminase [Lachnospiraceae bacterium]
MIRFVRARDYNDMSRKAANIISAQVIVKPESVLGLATGSSPIGAYECLVHWYEKGDLDFSQVTSVNLDEYRGLDHENEQSYYYFMHEHLFGKVNIDPERTFVPDGTILDAKEACETYDAIVNATGGVDLQVLGLGHNGHIGFNEPDQVFAKGTHCVDLSESTIEANARFFASKEEVPTQAYTMGIQTIMNARKILVVVSGQAKAEIVKEAFFGDVTPWVPASILQLHHHVTVVGDEEAFSQIADLI